MAFELTVTVDSEITLPQAVLEHLGVKPGEKVEVSLLPNGRVELRAMGAGAPLSRLCGVIHQDGMRVGDAGGDAGSDRERRLSARRRSFQG